MAMSIEFQKGDVIVEIGEDRWRFLVVAVNENFCTLVMFRMKEKIHMFDNIVGIENESVQRDFVKVSHMKVPGFIDDRCQMVLDSYQ